ncbi:MAG: nucleotidyltransferase family protein [Bacteroidales bacterium]|nr:nucleotidyltransferase family protein [Bacteroidales bacterium]
MIPEAVILAGGLGTRLGNITKDVPKPMVDVNGRPFLSYLLDLLISSGVSKTVIAVGYKSEKIIEYFGSQYKKLNIEYSIEEELLGTGGALKKALYLCEGTQVFVLNGDTYNVINYRKMFSQHLHFESPVTMATCLMEHSDRYGTVEIKDNKVSLFKEKGYVEKGYINRGVYIIDRRLLQGISESKFSLEKDVLEIGKQEIRIFESDGYFIDIGIEEDYRKACFYFGQG